MLITPVRLLTGGMINLIGQVGGEVIGYSTNVIKRVLKETFGEGAENYTDLISVILSIIITILVIYYILKSLENKK
jgi:hypothetical protein